MPATSTQNGVTAGGDIALWGTRDLLGVFRDERLASPSNYFRNLFFSGAAHLSTREYIDFEKIKSRRPIAPFVMPNNVGQGVYTRTGSTVTQFKPAYIKAKDPVVPAESFRRAPGDLLTPVPMTPQQVFDAEVVNVLQTHREAVDRRCEWLAAQAILNGKVNITYSDGTSVIVDFNRPAENTIDKSGIGDVSKTWAGPDYDILGDIQDWSDMMALQDFGAMPTRLTVGQTVWKHMRKNKGIIAEMSLLRRGNTELEIPTGLIQSSGITDNNARFIGTLGAGIQLWVYNDFYQNEVGKFIRYMDPRDVLLTGPGVDGVQAFGAIVDKAAGLQPMQVFSKMWDENDPSETLILTQSAPLMIPVNPTQTLRARVCA